LSGLTTGHSWAFDEQGNQIKDIQLLGDKNWSDIIRRRQIQQVIERISIPSFFIGHGFGMGIPVRKIHMEIAYLEIFHKQGLFGLVFWLILFFVIIHHYRQAVLNQQGAAALPFFMGALFIFIQSVTNQYINNPIGLTMVLVALAVLKVLSKTSEQSESIEKG
ncbi:MAG: hypothetical protein O6848_00915, partial [Bacteroidetes bacterium]|nr:hypothetical protein [Bacteroidota bacterium]